MYKHSKSLFLKLEDAVTSIINFTDRPLHGLQKSGSDTVPYAVGYLPYKNMLQW